MPIVQPIEREEYRPSLRMALCLATGGDHIFLSEKQDPAERYTPAPEDVPTAVGTAREYKGRRRNLRVSL